MSRSLWQTLFPYLNWAMNWNWQKGKRGGERMYATMAPFKNCFIYWWFCPTLKAISRLSRMWNLEENWVLIKSAKVPLFPVNNASQKWSFPQGKIKLSLVWDVCFSQCISTSNVYNSFYSLHNGVNGRGRISPNIEFQNLHFALEYILLQGWSTEKAIHF